MVIRSGILVTSVREEAEVDEAACDELARYEFYR
jgi:hypothetical protein